MLLIIVVDWQDELQVTDDQQPILGCTGLCGVCQMRVTGTGDLALQVVVFVWRLRFPALINSRSRLVVFGGPSLTSVSDRNAGKTRFSVATCDTSVSISVGSVIVFRTSVSLCNSDEATSLLTRITINYQSVADAAGHNLVFRWPRNRMTESAELYGWVNMQLRRTTGGRSCWEAFGYCTNLSHFCVNKNRCKVRGKIGHLNSTSLCVCCRQVSRPLRRSVASVWTKPIWRSRSTLL